MPDGALPISVAEFQTKLFDDWLAKQAGAGSVEHLQRPTPLSGGAVQQHWALDVAFAGGQWSGRHNLVLRANFQTPLPASRSKAQEFAILRAVAAAGVAAPEPLWLCDDPGVIGQPFFVMRRYNGDAAARPLVAAAARAGFGPALVARWGRELAKIHALSPDDPRLACIGKPPGSSARDQIAHWRGWLRDLAPETSVLAGALDQLERCAPSQRRTCLVHRDFRTGNFLIDNEDLAVVLDWEFASWGDPHEDIGWFCAACWRAGRDDLEAGGLAARETFYGAYEAAGGTTVDAAAVAFWELMAHVRWAIIARQQGARAARGDRPQHELLEAAAKVPGLERAIAAMIAAKLCSTEQHLILSLSKDRGVAGLILRQAQHEAQL